MSGGRRGSMWALLRKEVRLLTRSRMAFWGFALVLLLVAGILCMFWADEAGRHTMNNRASFGKTLFEGISLMLMGSLMFVSPVLGATAFTDERERKTYDLLATAGFSHPAMICGKWLAAMFYQLLIIICLMPLLSVVLQLGGVEPRQFGALAVVLLVTTGFFAMLGLAVSAIVRTTMRAMVITIAGLLIVPVGSLPVAILMFRFLNLNPSDDILYFLSILSPVPAFMFNVFLEASGGGISPTGVLYVFVLSYSCFWIIAYYLARFGLRRIDSRRGLGPEKLIDDPNVLLQRRLSFPFYLIDPLRRPHDIPDGADPLVAREERAGSRARLRATIRLIYLGATISVLSGMGYIFSSTHANMMHAAQLGLCFSAIFLPLIAATAITREREEGTFDLLRTVPVTAWRIVLAKWRASLRLIAVLFAGTVLVPVVAGLLLRGQPVEHLVSIVRAVIYAGSYLALYTAVAIFCSAYAKRNAAAMVLAYLLIACMLLLPYPVCMTHEEFSRPVYYYQYRDHDVPQLVRTMTAAFSPLLGVENVDGSGDTRYNVFGYSEMWGALLLQALLTALGTLFFLNAAERQLRKAKE